MRKLLIPGLFLLISVLLIAACSAVQTDDPARAVEAYWQALVAQDSARISSLSCKDFEVEALNTLESFKSVATTLNNLVCTTDTKSDSSATVKCSGTIVASYGNENLTLNLADRSYSAVKEGNTWLMCGAQ
jgi:hypothetical protein